MVAGSHGSSFNFIKGDTPFTLENGLSALKEKSKHEEESNNNSRLNNTDDRKNVFIGSNKNSESNHVKPGLPSPFKNPILTQENISNKMIDFHGDLNKDPPLVKLDSLEGSEKMNMTIVEEEQLEKKLISENLTRKDNRKSKKGKDFNETMNNIYDDLDRTLQEVEKHQYDTPKEVKEFEFDNLNILQNVDLDLKDRKSIEEKQKKIDDLKKNSLNINEFKPINNDQFIKDDLKSSKFDFKEKEEALPKEVEISHDEDDNKSIHSNILNQFIKPSPKIYTRKKMGRGRYAIHTENVNPIEKKIYYGSRIKSSSHNQIKNNNFNEKDSDIEVYLSHQNNQMRTSSAYNASKKYYDERIIPNKSTKNKWSQGLYDSSKLYIKQQNLDRHPHKNNFKFLKNNQANRENEIKTVHKVHKRAASSNILNSFIKSPRKSLEHTFTSQQRGRWRKKTNESLLREDDDHPNSHLSKFKSNQAHTNDEMESKVRILFSKIFVYTSKIEILKMKLHKEAGEDVCYFIFRQFCNTQTGELNVESLEKMLNYLNFQIDLNSLHKILLYLIKYRMPLSVNKNSIDSDFFHQIKNKNLFNSFYNIKSFDKEENQDMYNSAINHNQNNSVYSIIHLQYEDFRELFMSHKIVIPEIYLFCNWDGKKQSENIISRSSYYLLRQILMLLNRMLADISRIIKSLQIFDSNQIFEYIYGFSENISNSEDLPSQDNLKYNQRRFNSKQENSHHPSFSNNNTHSNLNTKNHTNDIHINTESHQENLRNEINR